MIFKRVKKKEKKESYIWRKNFYMNIDKNGYYEFR